MAKDPKFSLLLKDAKTAENGEIVFGFDGADHIAFSTSSEACSALLRDGKFKKAVKTYDDLLAQVEKPANCITGYVELTKAMVFHLRNSDGKMADKGDALFVDKCGWKWYEADSDIMISVNAGKTAFQIEYGPQISMATKNKKYMREFTKNPIFGSFRSTTSLDELVSLVKQDVSEMFPHIDADKLIGTISSKLG